MQFVHIRRGAVLACALTALLALAACGGSEEPAATTLPPLRLPSTTTQVKAVPRGTYGTSTTRTARSTLPGDDARTKRINEMITSTGMSPTLAACLVDAAFLVATNPEPGTTPNDNARRGLESIVRCQEIDRAPSSTTAR